MTTDPADSSSDCSSAVSADYFTLDVNSLGLLSEDERTSRDWRSRSREDQDEILRNYVNGLALPSALPTYGDKAHGLTIPVDWVGGKRVVSRVVFESWADFDGLATEAWEKMLSARREKPSKWKKMFASFELTCEIFLNEYHSNEAAFFFSVGHVLRSVCTAVSVLGDRGVGVSGYPCDKLRSQSTHTITTERLPNRNPDAYNITLITDFSMFNNDDDVQDEGSIPIAAIEVTSTKSLLVTRHADGDNIGSVFSHGEFIKDLNEKFSSDQNLRSAVARRMGQALSEAVLTRGGYGILTNHNKALFIRVRKGSRSSKAFAPETKNNTPSGSESKSTESSTEGKGMRSDAQDIEDEVVGQISRLFSCDAMGGLGTFPAMVAFCREAHVDAAKQSRREELLKCIEILAGLKPEHPSEAVRSGDPSKRGNSENRGDSETQQTRNRKTLRPRNGSEGIGVGSNAVDGLFLNVNGEIQESSQHGGNSDTHQRRDAEGITRPFEEPDNSDALKSRNCSQKNIVLDDRWSRWWSSPYCNAKIDLNSWFAPVGDVVERLAEFDASWKDIHQNKDEGGSCIRRCVEEWTDDDLTIRAYLQTDGLAGIGGTGIVMTGVVDGVAAAIKHWSRLKEETKLMLRDEMLMYCWLASMHERVMGTAVPKLLGVGEDHYVGAILVTELVGEAVRQKRGGELTVGGRSVGTRERDEIRRAAVKSLRLLHNCGVRHWDVELRNLRVARVNDMDGDGSGWRAWWIDLGLARLESSAMRLAKEEEHCSIIFHPDYIEEQ